MDTATEELGPGPSSKPEAPERPDPRRLERSTTDRMLAGVASGLADYLGVDTSIVRIAFVILSLFGGVGLVLYGSGWLLMPENGCDLKRSTQRRWRMPEMVSSIRASVEASC